MSEKNFFAATAIWYLLTVFWGFAPSFYLLSFFDSSEDLPMHLVIHGIIFSIWTLFYVLQVFLIRSKNYNLHRSLGIFGLLVMILMIPTGIFPSIYKVYAGTTSVDAAGHNVFRLTSVYIFFAFAFVYRKKPFYHKRLILACMIMLIGAAVFRISFDFGLQESQLFNKGIQVLPALVLFTLDFFRFKKAILLDLVPVITVFAIFFFADIFWLSQAGELFMNFLISVFVLPFA